MKAMAIKDFEFYILPKVKKFIKGEEISTPTYAEDRIKSMHLNGFVKIIGEKEMENKMLVKKFTTASEKAKKTKVKKDKSPATEGADNK